MFGISLEWYDPIVFMAIAFGAPLLGAVIAAEVRKGFARTAS